MTWTDEHEKRARELAAIACVLEGCQCGTSMMDGEIDPSCSQAPAIVRAIRAFSEPLLAEVATKREATLEEAAKLAETACDRIMKRHRRGSYGDLGWDTVAEACDDLADEIRALAMGGGQ